jgi:nucleoside-diphosphate-sugar epimerase
MKVLVIGGTLFIGRHLVKELLARKYEVWVLHRRRAHDLGAKVSHLIADRNDAAEVKRLLARERFDAVFDDVYDWERGTTARHVQAAVTACGDNLQRYVFMSSVAAYGDGLNHLEGDALAPDEHPETYVRNKAMTERMLFKLHARYGTPVVTLRPPFVYGPGNPFYREAFFWDRLRDKRPIVIPGDGRRLMQFVHVKDLVAACLKAMDEPNAIGHAFNIADRRPVTQVEFVNALAKAAGKKAALVKVPREQIFGAGGHPMGPKLYFGMYYDMPPITMLIAKAQRMLKFKPTPLADGMAETYRWYLRNRRKSVNDYAFEDELLASAGKGQRVSALLARAGTGD